ncbi:MAG TPA: nucleotide exchange factor GrpE, partial [Vicinamibacterales bacterium]
MSEELKVTDRRWWARGADAVTAEEPKLKPTYIEELEARLAAKDAELQQIISKYRGASEEFDQARARLRKEVSKDLERGRRALLVSFLEVLDNLDRAIDSIENAFDPDAVLQGIMLVRSRLVQLLKEEGLEKIF